MAGGEFLEQDLPHLVLPPGEREWQPRIECREQAVALAHPGNSSALSECRTTMGHGQLHAEGLIELQPLDATLRISFADGFMHLTQGLRKRQHTGLLNHPVRQGVAKRQHLRQGQGDGIGDLPGDHLRGRRVEADEPRSLDHLHHGGSRIRLPTCDGAELINDHVVGVAQLRLTPKLTDFPHKDPSRARSQLVRPELRIAGSFGGHEERCPQLAVSVGQHCLHPRGPAVDHGRMPHPCDHCDVLAGSECAEVAHLSAREVTTWRMPQQITQSEKPQLRQLVGGVCPHDIAQPTAQLTIDRRTKAGHGCEPTDQG